eukprot:2728733-Amphidinium_carterae.1
MHKTHIAQCCSVQVIVVRNQPQQADTHVANLWKLNSGKTNNSTIVLPVRRLLFTAKEGNGIRMQTCGLALHKHFLHHRATHLVGVSAADPLHLPPEVRRVPKDQEGCKLVVVLSRRLQA